ncbi:MAG: FKBP-type peptidyl-prolyl cis-trans isomerase [Flavobacteriales bacterium]|nr:FKBP-type peptidyl-prolyl cis-trans isomerase [Flavobacteriales bacterium]
MSGRLLGFLVALGLLASCDRSPYAGYKVVGEEVHMRYHRLGDGETVPSDSDSVFVRFRVSYFGDEPGSFLSTDRWYRAGDLRAGAMVPVLRRMHAGDSMSVIAEQRLWPWRAMSGGAVPAAADSATLQTEIALLAIRTPAEVRKEMVDMRRSDPAAFERLIIQSFIDRSTDSLTRWGTSDMHYAIAAITDDTARVRFGDRITVAWKGSRLIEGTVFDERPMFSWRYGDPDQVIKGIEVAVSLLRAGQEGSFVIPSSLAFAGRGIPGTLEPYSPVLYHVRLVGVERARANP